MKWENPLLVAAALGMGYWGFKGLTTENYKSENGQGIFMAQHAIRQNKLDMSALQDKYKVWHQYNDLNRLPDNTYIHHHRTLFSKKDRAEYDRTTELLSSTANYGRSTGYSNTLAGLKQIWDKHLMDTRFKDSYNDILTTMILNLGEAIDVAKSSKKYRKAWAARKGGKQNLFGIIE